MRLTFVFDFFDLVSQNAGTFVVFIGNGLIEVAAEFDELRSTTRCLADPLGNLADVFRLTVNVENQCVKLIDEVNVIVWATEATAATEVVKTDSAGRTSLHVEFLEFLGGLAQGSLLGQALSKGRGNGTGEIVLRRRHRQIAPCVVFAKM